MKNPGIAAVLSFFIPGLGQLYNGQFKKMAVFLILDVVNILLSFILIGYVTGIITWIIGMVDAYKSATRLNQEAGNATIVRWWVI